MEKYSTADLIAFLIAMIEVQIMAVKCKQTGLPNHHSVTKKDKDYPNWLYLSGICSNVYRSPCKLVESGTFINLRNYLFSRAQTISGDPICPVIPARGVNYSSRNPNEFWGDHPYADNRRQLIQECIDQLHAELQKRDYNVG